MSDTKPDQPAARLAAAWAALQPRERRGLALAAAVLGLALLWWLALAPALATLRAAPAQRAELQAQAQRMQRWQREAEALKAQPRLARDTAVAALEAATRQRLGNTAQLSLAGERAQVTLTQASAQDLADWLADVRASARAVPLDARLTRSGDAAPGAAVHWSGTLSLSLPS
ncbi:MAG: type II secretion system protein M [Proteobacteria bacterium]|nr:type II secretion system protein M [Pseudomonadota bacterium]